jgi:hypothetical protein
MDKVADPLGFLDRGVRGPGQVASQVAKLVVCGGEPGGLQETRAAQGLCWKHSRPVVTDPFDYGGKPELNGLRHALGAQPGDNVAMLVPA